MSEAGLRKTNSFSLYKALKVLVFIAPLLYSALLAARAAHAAIDDDDQEISYDVIVNNLNRQVNSAETTAGVNRVKAARPVVDPFETIWMHAGIGFSNALENITEASGAKSSFNLKGFQAQIGIDLFSENWMAEGTVRSFSDADESKTHASLKEFELKLFYKDHLTRGLGFRAGGGVSGRYLSFQSGTGESLSYTTPSSVATFGLDFYMAERFSVGIEISGRAAMISDTADRSSIDGSVRLDTHF